MRFVRHILRVKIIVYYCLANPFFMAHFHQQIFALIVGAHTEREREREREHTFVLSVKILFNNSLAFLLPPSEPFFAARVPFLSLSIPFLVPEVPILSIVVPLAAPSVPFLPEKGPLAAPSIPLAPPDVRKLQKFSLSYKIKH